ncbi:hypothetical protein [Niallia sp. Man26]|uniref:hypothetical protein n=1 Tax=Niallia TaxID=2837506 RepID=UPI001EDC32FE|nr:hypothetical protein [Niallia sp. Man26]UPO90356.1 hypothetical protein L8T27_020000 [Niallia sp. Man26]
MRAVFAVILIIIGSILLSITFYDELVKTIIYKLVGFSMMSIGVVNLRKFTRRRRKEKHSAR